MIGWRTCGYVAPTCLSALSSNCSVDSCGGRLRIFNLKSSLYISLSSQSHQIFITNKCFSNHGFHYSISSNPFSGIKNNKNVLFYYFSVMCSISTVLCDFSYAPERVGFSVPHRHFLWNQWRGRWWGRAREWRLLARPPAFLLIESLTWAKDSSWISFFLVLFHSLVLECLFPTPISSFLQGNFSFHHPLTSLLKLAKWIHFLFVGGEGAN